MNKSISFSNLPLGPYTEAQVNTDWNTPPRIRGAKSGRTDIVADPLGPGLAEPSRASHVLRVRYPKGKVGQEEDGGGAQWRLRFDEAILGPGAQPLEKCTVEYRVMFPEGFDFVKGGKLPGMSGGASPAGGKKSDGTDGFSARIMWRERGEIFQYMYWMERSADKNWGDDFPWKDASGAPLRFIPGTWHTLKTEITMNTPGERNGRLISWLDGVQALSIQGAFRAAGATWGIDSFNFTTFFGGNTADWGPGKDEVVYFGEVKIFT